MAGEPAEPIPSADDVWELCCGPVLLAQVPLKNNALKLARAR
ncbi:hypothetical protein WME95_20520 [Sorangium sp. So ce327]